MLKHTTLIRTLHLRHLSPVRLLPLQMMTSFLNRIHEYRPGTQLVPDLKKMYKTAKIQARIRGPWIQLVASGDVKLALVPIPGQIRVEVNR